MNVRLYTWTLPPRFPVTFRKYLPTLWLIHKMNKCEMAKRIYLNIVQKNSSKNCWNVIVEWNVFYSFGYDAIRGIITKEDFSLIRKSFLFANLLNPPYYISYFSLRFCRTYNTFPCVCNNSCSVFKAVTLWTIEWFKELWKLSNWNPGMDKTNQFIILYKWHNLLLSFFVRKKQGEIIGSSYSFAMEFFFVRQNCFIWGACCLCYSVIR